MSILIGNGDGTFQAAKNLAVGSNASSLAIGDFNGDGKLDLALFVSGNATSSTTGEIRILLGNGDGSFQSPVATTLATSALIFKVGDFNGDKNDDIIIVSSTSTSGSFGLQLALGKGDGSFQAPQGVVTNGLVSAQVVAADFNKDGHLDVAVSGSDGVYVLKGKGDGTFVAGTTTTPLSLGTVSSFWTADFNGDGNVDLLVESRRISCTTGELHICTTSQAIGVMLGDGKGSLAAEQVLSTGVSSTVVSTLISSLSIGDFNGDGKLDVAYRQRSGAAPALQVKLGKGDGTFAPPVLLPDAGPVAAAAALNGDKLADLVTLDSSNGNVDVLLNESPATGADLGMIKSSASPEPVGVGQNLTYTTDILNEGPGDATGVTLTDTLPGSVDFVSTTASQGSCSQSGQLVTCTIGGLVDAHDAQIAITVKPAAANSVTNNMSVAGNEPDLAGANNSASQVSTVIPVYTLTVTKSGSGSGTITSDAGLGGGINCGTACSNTYLSGATANLAINTDAGSLFQSWGGACAGTANNTGCSIVMNSNKTVTANIVLGITLSVSITGGGTGSVTSDDGSISCNDTGGTCSSLNLPGTQVTLTATPTGSSQFSSWSGACTGSNPNSCSVTLSAKQSVTANILPPPDFTISAAAKNVRVGRGAQANDTLTFPAQGNFAGTIALACSVNGPTPMPTCAVAPASVKPGDTATLTIDARSLSTALFRRGESGQSGGLFASWLPLGLLGGIMAASFDKKRRKLLALCFCLAAAAVLPAACGGGSVDAPMHAAQNYTVTVTATSGTVQHLITISVTVQ